MEFTALLQGRKLKWGLSQALLMVGNVFYTISSAIMVQYIFLAIEQNQKRYIWTALVLFVIGMMVSCLAKFSGNLMQKKIMNKLVLDMKEKVYRNSVGIPAREEEYLHLMNEDMENIRGFLMENMGDIVTAVCTIAVSLVLILRVSLFIGSILFLLLVLSGLNQLFLFKRQDKINGKLVKSEKNLYEAIAALAQMQDVLRSFHGRRYGLFYFEEKADRYYCDRMSELVSRLKYVAANGILEYSSTVIPFMLMFLSVLTGRIQLSDGIYILQISGNMVFFGSKMVPALLKFGKMKLSCFRIAPYLQEVGSQTVPQKESAHVESISIKTEDLSITYGERCILKSFSADIPGIGILLLLGASGSGKSSVVRSLLGIQDYDGAIRFFDESGNELAREAAEQSVTYVPQRLELFKETVYQNIQYGNPTCTEREVREAAQAAGISEWIERLPLQYETQFQGENFSGGEIRKIMIARALTKKAGIFLLDEPTANLDAQSAKSLVEKLKEMGKECLVIMVTHDVSLLSIADHFIYIESGYIKYASEGICRNVKKEISKNMLVDYLAGSEA